MANRLPFLTESLHHSAPTCHEQVMQDPRQALKEAFVGQRRNSLTASTGSGSTASGRRESDPSWRMSLILMRRVSASNMGDKVLKDVETQYKVHA